MCQRIISYNKPYFKITTYLFLCPIYVSEKLTIVFTPYSFLIISILSRNASSTDYTIKQISIKIGNKDLYIMISFDDIFI